MFFVIALEQTYQAKAISPIDSIQRAAVCTEPLADKHGYPMYDGTLELDRGVLLHACGQFSHYHEAHVAMCRLFNGRMGAMFMPFAADGHVNRDAIIETRSSAALIRLDAHQTLQYIHHRIDDETLEPLGPQELTAFETFLGDHAEFEGFELDYETLQRVLEKRHSLAVARGPLWARLPDATRH